MVVLSSSGARIAACTAWLPNFPALQILLKLYFIPRRVRIQLSRCAMLADRLRHLSRPSPDADASDLTTTPEQEQDAIIELDVLRARLDGVRARYTSTSLTDRPAVTTAHPLSNKPHQNYFPATHPRQRVPLAPLHEDHAARLTDLGLVKTGKRRRKRGYVPTLLFDHHDGRR